MQTPCHAALGAAWKFNVKHNLETRAALCADRGTAFARHPATTHLLKKRRRAEYRLPSPNFAR
jgi:hypothetical protein